ncbi:MAG TPA: hypothetical protein ENN33_03620, partial [Ignavibacteria bacterium]|nr:hypothetical protein [Ignavibacteria bacterium]
MKSSYKNFVVVLLSVIFFSSCTKEIVKQQDFPSEINVYFNKDADTSYAFPNNKANFYVNFEDKLIHRINNASSTIDMMAYEINLPRLINSLITRASEGIQIRFIIDAKSYEEEFDDDTTSIERYTLMRLYLEQMSRGKDNIPGTDDDIMLLSDSPILAVADSTLRKKFNLPPLPIGYKRVNLKIGNKEISGHLLVDAELKDPRSCSNCYYSPGYQMHNKFAIIDTQWVFTGSWNFTVTGLYGSVEEMVRGELNGNQNHIIEIRNRDLSHIYLTEFNEMWGGSQFQPNP